MPTLVAGIQVFSACPIEDVDGRDTPGSSPGAAMTAERVMYHDSWYYLIPVQFDILQLTSLVMSKCSPINSNDASSSR
jgi:hypothetical protein